MIRTRSCLLLVCALGLLGPPAWGRGGSVVVNVTPAFRTGPYTTLTINPENPERMAVGTADGYVSWTSDGGATSKEAQVLFARKFAILPLRPNPQRRIELQTGLMKAALERGAHRLFIQNLMNGMPVTRWAIWMALDDTITEVSDIALPAEQGRMAVASPSGLYISDPSRGAWMRALGLPRPKGQDVIAFAVAISPTDPSHLIASTSEGFAVSHNGGQTFTYDPQSKLSGEQVRKFLWNPTDAKRILAVTPEAVFESSDGGKSFSPALNANEEINAVALSPDGAYVATSKGLLVATGQGKEETRFKEEKVVGVVPLGEGYALTATEGALYLVAPQGARTLVRTTATDPFLRLAGTPELAWALTKYEIFRIGAREARAQAAVPDPPRVKVSETELERAVLTRIGLYHPHNTRLADRWYAKLIPRIVFRVQGVIENNYSVSYDGTFPIRYRSATFASARYYGGEVPGEMGGGDVMIMANWDISRFFFGENSNVTNPNGFVEQGLRQTREDVLNEVRWRYREMANLAHLLEHPPLNEQTAFLWQIRLEEHAAYLEAMSGRKVISMAEQQEVR